MVRNSKEFGPHLKSICRRLLSNENLCKLLINTDLDPLSHNVKKKPEQILEDNIRVKPYVDPRQSFTESVIVVLITNGENNIENNEFMDIDINVLVYCPIKSWIINNDALRPFSIISEVEESLKGKNINGLGKLEYNGFKLDILTDEMAAYRLMFMVNDFK